jgi:hypothetical protein
LQRSNDNAACGHDSKFKPLILGENQAADDKQGGELEWTIALVRHPTKAVRPTTQIIGRPF